VGGSSVAARSDHLRRICSGEALIEWPLGIDPLDGVLTIPLGDWCVCSENLDMLSWVDRDQFLVLVGRTSLSVLSGLAGSRACRGLDGLSRNSKISMQSLSRCGQGRRGLPHGTTPLPHAVAGSCVHAVATVIPSRSIEPLAPPEATASPVMLHRKAQLSGPVSRQPRPIAFRMRSS
jgi:hypothetical protein